MLKVILDSFKDKILLIRYGIAGAIGVGTNLTVFTVAAEFLGWWYMVSAILAFAVSLVVAFLLQKYWTFGGAEGKAHLQFASYFAISVLNLVINMALLYMFVEVFGIWQVVSQAIALGIVAVLSFLLNRNVTFSRL